MTTRTAPETMPSNLPRGVAIRVVYHGPTDARGSRWIATADLPAPMHRVTVGYDYELPQGAPNAYTAAAELVRRWTADHTTRHGVDAGRYAIIAGGHLADGSYAFIANYARTDDTDSDAAVLADILTGPTSVENARRLAEGAARHLAASPYQIVRR